MPEVQELMAFGIPSGAASLLASIRAGAGSGSMQDQGNIHITAGAAVNPASTGGDIVMDFFSIPALTFDQPGRSIAFEAYGSTASVTNARTIKIIVNCTTAVVGSAVSGGTTIASITSSATAGSGGWFIGAQITKYGVAGSNTQSAVHFAGQMGSVAIALVAPQALTLAENAAILCAVTVNAATTATDASFNMFQMNMMN